MDSPCLPFKSFNTQPPEGGCVRSIGGLFCIPIVSTHSRPKAAAFAPAPATTGVKCFNTQPPEGGCLRLKRRQAAFLMFQHTAARRRLRSGFSYFLVARYSFNTQPPEGGCSLYKKMIKISKLFTVFRYPLKYKEYQEV